MREGEGIEDLKHTCQGGNQETNVSHIANGGQFDSPSGKALFDSVVRVRVVHRGLQGEEVEGGKQSLLVLQL